MYTVLIPGSLTSCEPFWRSWLSTQQGPTRWKANYWGTLPTYIHMWNILRWKRKQAPTQLNVHIALWNNCPATTHIYCIPACLGKNNWYRSRCPWPFKSTKGNFANVHIWTNLYTFIHIVHIWTHSTQLYTLYTFEHICANSYTFGPTFAEVSTHNGIPQPCLDQSGSSAPNPPASS